MNSRRTGIFSGVFDPVHDGHISFALEALKQTKLDEVYLVIEAKPRRKTGVTHPTHHLAMAKLATAPYPGLKVLELPDKQLSVATTMPRLKKRFGGSAMSLLIGADMLEHMPSWPLINRLLEDMELIVGTRTNYRPRQIQELINNLPTAPEASIIKSPHSTISSRAIRDKLHAAKPAGGLSPDVEAYIKAHWLYVSPSSAKSSPPKN